MSTATRPAALGKGTIAFISPSARLNHVFPKRIARAKAWLQSQGHRIIEIFDAIPASTDLPGQRRIRSDEIHKAFEDPEVKAIICTIGGTDAESLLAHLDYELIKRNPKIFCGYSDITVLHNALFTRCGLRTFYGPAVIPSFGEFPAPEPFTVTNFYDAVDGRDRTGLAFGRSTRFTQEYLDWSSDESNVRARRHEPSPSWTWLRGGKVEGRLLGGCLPSLNQIRKSEWYATQWPDYRGKILFIETPEGDDAPNAIYTIEQARKDLRGLQEVGLLKLVAGMMVGRPLFYTPSMRAEFEAMLSEETEGLDMPIVANVDIGHTSPAVTILYDTLVRLDSASDSIVYLE